MVGLLARNNQITRLVSCTRCCVTFYAYHSLTTTLQSIQLIYIHYKMYPTAVTQDCIQSLQLADTFFSSLVSFLRFDWRFPMISMVIGSWDSFRASVARPPPRRTARWALNTCPASPLARFLPPSASSSARSYLVSLHWCPWSFGRSLLHHCAASRMN